MPVRSPDPSSEPVPHGDSLFAESGDFATEISGIADGDIALLESLHALDPDQVAAEEVVKKRLGWLFWIAVAWFALVAILAILAPILPLDSYKATSSCIRCSPSSQHWFGTDTLGRDIFSRIIWGARVSLVVGLSSVAFGVLVGGTFGLVAGYFKGRTESAIMWAMDVILAFPALLLTLAIITFTGERTWQIISLAIGIVAIAPLARLVRASTLANTEREYVMAARALGASNLRIMWKEVLPNVILPVLSFSIISVAVAIVAEGGLAFLGLSVPPPEPTWGSMINDGRAYLETSPYISLIPCAVMFLTVLALNLAGDRVREYFDVKEGGL